MRPHGYIHTIKHESITAPDKRKENVSSHLNPVQKHQPVIEINGLKKRYKGSQELALKGITISINEKEIFGLLGPNAAGKTTLILLMCGILKITEGKIITCQINIKHHALKIRRIIGLVPQNIALYPSLTIKENLYFFGQMYGLKGKILKKRIAECLTEMGLEKHANKRVSACSGGIQRRGNLVAGIIHNPQILFLDEPTVSIDAQSRNFIFDTIKRINKEGTTIIYTTHYMEEAEELCSRVAIIDDGKIIALNTPQMLIGEHEGCEDLSQVFLKLTGKRLRD
jgi:ABC-2 type transport system ATP-binding protein